MKVIKDDAIVIESIQAKKADIIVTFFSKDYGMIKGIAEGARKVKSRFIGCFEPLNYVIISYFVKENEELVRINECEIISSIIKHEMEEEEYYAIFYLSELIKEFGVSCKNIRLFNVIRDIHYSIIKHINLALLMRWAELQLLKEHGSLALVKECSRCKEEIINNRYIGTDGAIKCEKCYRQGDLKLQEEIFVLMNKLLYVKIENLDNLIVDDAKLKRAGAVAKYLIQNCIEKPLRFYDFYRQIIDRKKQEM